MKIMFLDESGDHNLSLIDPQYPIFVLGGVIVDEYYYYQTIVPLFEKFKLELFNDENIILHTADIGRNRNGFENLKDTTTRHKFIEKLNELMSNLNYKVIACIIRKEEHLKKYGLHALDPYLISLDILVEQFIFEIKNENGLIIAESRGTLLDAEIEIAWLNLRLQGTNHVQAKNISNKIQALNIRAKKHNDIGLQLADLVISPIARKAIGKKTNLDYHIVESKLRRSIDNIIEGYGIIDLPK